MPKLAQQPGGSLTEALEQREREGRPVRVGLVGAGQMGTDIIVQTAQMRGIEVVAAADAIADRDAEAASAAMVNVIFNGLRRHGAAG